MCFEGTSKRTNERKKAHIMGNVKWLCNVWKSCLRDDDDDDEESRREVKRTAVWIDRQEERIKMRKLMCNSISSEGKFAQQRVLQNVTLRHLRFQLTVKLRFLFFFVCSQIIKVTVVERMA